MDFWGPRSGFPLDSIWFNALGQLTDNTWRLHTVPCPQRWSRIQNNLCLSRGKLVSLCQPESWNLPSHLAFIFLMFSPIHFKAPKSLGHGLWFFGLHCTHPSGFLPSANQSFLPYTPSSCYKIGHRNAALPREQSTRWRLLWKQHYNNTRSH